MIIVYLLNFFISILEWIFSLLPWNLGYSAAEFLSNVLFLLPKINYLWPIYDFLAYASYAFYLELSLQALNAMLFLARQGRVFKK